MGRTAKIVPVQLDLFADTSARNAPDDAAGLAPKVRPDAADRGTDAPGQRGHAVRAGSAADAAPRG